MEVMIMLLCGGVLMACVVFGVAVMGMWGAIERIENTLKNQNGVPHCTCNAGTGNHASWCAVSKWEDEHA